MTNFSNWAKEKSLSVNNTKMKIMCCSYDKGNHKLAADSVHSLGHATVNELKILGVTIAHNLSFNEYINKIVIKCNKIFYLLLILKQYKLLAESCKDMFNALIMPHITYGIVAWSGFSKDQDLKRLRKIMR